MKLATFYTEIRPNLTEIPDYAYCKPYFPYDFKPLKPAAAAVWDRWEADGFYDKRMLTLSPPPGATWAKAKDPVLHEKRVERMVEEYEGATGRQLRAEGYVSNGPKGIGAAEAHLIFKGRVDIVALKRAAKSVGDVKVTGPYAKAEDWMVMSEHQKNCPPHEGCLHYVASHDSHPGRRALYFAPNKPKSRAKKRKRAGAPFERLPENTMPLATISEAQEGAARRTFRRKYGL